MRAKEARRTQVSPWAQRSPATVPLSPAGDGIGPEISGAVQQIFKAAGAPVEWELQVSAGAANSIFGRPWGP